MGVLEGGTQATETGKKQDKDQDLDRQIQHKKAAGGVGGQLREGTGEARKVHSGRGHRVTGQGLARPRLGRGAGAWQGGHWPAHWVAVTVTQGTDHTTLSSHACPTWRPRRFELASFQVFHTHTRERTDI